jgi:hypothetical protein
VIAVVGICCFAISASADTINYSWEDGGTILGSYGNLVDPTNVTGPQTGSSGGGGTYTCPGAYDGSYYLHVAEEPHDGTPQAYVAYIENLREGDVVDASVWGYDDTPGLSPSLRIWGHYAYNGDVNSYAGSAGGSEDYTAGTGWDEMAWSWTIPVDIEALVVEVRLYSYPTTADDRTDFWIDNLTVTAPNWASITVAPEPGSLVLLALGGLALLRRR